jgi:hypothetical protein
VRGPQIHLAVLDLLSRRAQELHWGRLLRTVDSIRLRSSGGVLLSAYHS